MDEISRSKVLIGGIMTEAGELAQAFLFERPKFELDQVAGEVSDTVI